MSSADSSLAHRGQANEAGASQLAIQAHYDVGDRFFRLWLDETMTYSCALWADGEDQLVDAQIRKLDYHAEQASVSNAKAVLDVGCGWGSLLRRLVEKHGVACAVGLTLSKAQADYIRELRLPGVEVALESWKMHEPKYPYDAIVSIGALEHFVRPEACSSERVREYREFFTRCAAWLRPDGWLSLQTIAYGRGGFSHGAISSIFPESDLPRLEELIVAAGSVFEVVRVRNDRRDYARTCRSWLSRLRARKGEAEKLVGSKTVRHYQAFLEASARGFDAGVFLLLRIQLRRLA